MAGSKNKRCGSDVIPKTFTFKTFMNRRKIEGVWKPAVNEYVEYSNKVSTWLCDNLTTFKLGECLKYMSPKATVKKGENGEDIIQEGQLYYMVCKNNPDTPLYKLFVNGAVKGVDGNTRNNIIYAVIDGMDIDGYHGNMLGFCETCYRRMGYISSVVSNLTTKIGSVKTNIRRRRIDQTSDSAALKEQCMYEMDKMHISSEKDWEKCMDYLNMCENANAQYISRMETLRQYYIGNKDEVDVNRETYSIGSLSGFNGCKRKMSDKCSMRISFNKKTISIRRKNDYTCDYVFKINLNGKSQEFNLMGNRQVMKYRKGDDKPTELVDIVNTHGCDVHFIINKGRMFVAFTSDTVNRKTADVEIGKVAGIDVNTKHMLLQTNITDDGRIDGYVNIYKELMEDKEFVHALTDEEKEYYTEISKTVTFGLIEANCIIERVNQQRYGDCDWHKLLLDRIIVRKMKELITRYTESGDNVNRIYLESVNEMRKSIKAYHILSEAYYSKQREYDLKMGYNDTSTKSKDTMDRRRLEHPFINTDTAAEILRKRDNIGVDLIGSRDNIVRYAYRILRDNGYGTISLEKLESSQFERTRRLPTTVSMLKYHRLLGKTMREAYGNESVGSLLRNGYYTAKCDSEGRITDMQYTQAGDMLNSASRFFNGLIKSIRFADIKDEFAKMSNSGSMNVVFVPPFYTSQMDSLTHKIYTVEKDDGKSKKTTIAGKRQVRKTQERHINGLNADFNAAMNIAWLCEDENMRGIMCKKTKNAYSEPAYDSCVSRPDSVIPKLSKMGCTTRLCV